MKLLEIDGNSLTLAGLREVAVEGRRVALAAAARPAMERSRAAVEALVAGERVAYAVNTGVGKLSEVRIPPRQIRELQVNLVRSHCAGVGEPLAVPEARAMMLLRANSLAKGLSGVRPLVVETLCALLNRGITPVVPAQGSVGASGDLAPLAHLALALMGEGQVFAAGGRGGGSQATRVAAAKALRAAGLKPVTLAAKEAISLINGTQAMLALGGLALLRAETLADSADVIGGLTLDALLGTDAALDERIHRARPHPGQMASAQNLRRMLAGSQIRESHRECSRVQDAYSLRAMPQVHGAVRDALAYCRRVFEIEMNAAVDNPLVFAAPGPQPGLRRAAGVRGGGNGRAFKRAASGEKTSRRETAGAAAAAGGEIISGGNFHGQPLAFALDFMAIALSALAGISERRLERMVNPALSEGLPPFLAPGAGVNSGFMLAQVTAAALVSENKVLAHPASVDSITTSGNKEDYVSMGMGAALKLRRVAENATRVLAIEAMAAAQALDGRAPLKSSALGERARAAIRRVCRRLERDRVLAGDFERLARLVESGALAKILR